MEDNLPAMTRTPKFLRKLVMKHYLFSYVMEKEETWEASYALS